MQMGWKQFLLYLTHGQQAPWTQFMQYFKKYNTLFHSVKFYYL